MRWLTYITAALLLCSCASRKHIERSVEQTATYNDSSMMASQFVLDSVWRDSSTIVQTVVEFYEPSGSDTVQAVKRIVRTEIQRNVSATKQTSKTDTIVSVSRVETEKSEKVLEESEKSSTFTYTITNWFWLIGIALILVIVIFLIRLIRVRKE